MIIGRGLAPFVAYTPAIYDRRRLWGRIAREVADVNRDVTIARAKIVDEHHYQRLMGTAGGPTDGAR